MSTAPPACLTAACRDRLLDIFTILRLRRVLVHGYTMESFRPPAPLRLDSSNLEDEWTSFEKKFNWFLLAIGADRKPDATKLAMLLTTVGDDAVRIFEAFTYAEGESADKFDIVAEVQGILHAGTQHRLWMFSVLATCTDARWDYRSVCYMAQSTGSIMNVSNAS